MLFGDCSETRCIYLFGIKRLRCKQSFELAMSTYIERRMQTIKFGQCDAPRQKGHSDSADDASAYRQEADASRVVRSPDTTCFRPCDRTPVLRLITSNFAHKILCSEMNSRATFSGRRSSSSSLPWCSGPQRMAVSVMGLSQSPLQPCCGGAAHDQLSSRARLLCNATVCIASPNMQMAKYISQD